MSIGETTDGLELKAKGAKAGSRLSIPTRCKTCKSFIEYGDRVIITTIAVYLENGEVEEVNKDIQHMNASECEG